MHKTRTHTYIFTLSIFPGCGIFGASSTGAAGASAVALEIVHKNLVNKTTTSKEAFEKTIPNELRDSLLKYPTVNFMKYQERLNSYIIRKRQIIDSIDTFIEHNQSSIPQEIIAWKDDIANRLDKIDISKTDLNFIRNNERLDKRENTPTEFIQLIDRYLEIINQMIDSRISVDIAAKIHNDFLKYTNQKYTNQESIDEEDEELILMNAYYNAQKELNKYQRNLAPVSKQFKKS